MNAMRLNGAWYMSLDNGFTWEHVGENFEAFSKEGFTDEDFVLF